MSRVINLFKHGLVKNSLIYTVSDAINKAVPFFILPVLSYYLVPADFGIVANFNVLLAILTLLVPLGASTILSVKFYKVSREEFKKYVGTTIIIGLLSSIVLSLITLLFSDILLKSFKLTLEIQLASIWIGLAALMTAMHLSIFRFQEKPVFFGVYGIFQTVVNVCVSLVLVICYKLGWIGRVEGIAVATISFGVFSFFNLYKSNWISFNISKALIHECLVFGLPLVPHSLSFWIRSSIDRILITSFSGEAETGLYSTGFQFGLLVSFLTLSFNNAFSPFILKNLSEENELKLENNKRKLVKITYFILGGLLFCSLFFIIFSNYFLKYFFSPNYLAASKYIPWAILSQMFQGFYLLVVNYIFFTKKTKQLATITFSTALLQIVLSYILINLYGGIGGAYSTTIVSFLTFVFVFILSTKVYPMKWY
ncbi:MAG: lipopolysaccharide biosynthesis protein [Sphingobacterium sp.]